MKRTETILTTLGILVALAILCFIISDSFLLITRASEKNLPSVTIENQNTVYCRMKADDFRFPLPPGSNPTDPQLTSGGSDTVEGSIIAHFPNNNRMTASQYQQWLKGHTQTGARIAAKQLGNSSTLVISFTYYGDK